VKTIWNQIRPFFQFLKTEFEICVFDFEKKNIFHTNSVTYRTLIEAIHTNILVEVNGNNYISYK